MNIHAQMMNLCHRRLGGLPHAWLVSVGSCTDGWVFGDGQFMEGMMEGGMFVR